MLLQLDDFREVFGAGGERFERLMNDLVRAEARRLGLAPNEIHWDQRTNVPDGGCDIWITKGHKDTSSFLPLAPTSISLKSGDDGTRPSTFAREVRDHSGLVERLRQGSSFLWCCPRPLSQERRAEFVAMAKDLATEIKCSDTQFAFFWIDAISARVEQSPHLISEHLPTAWRRLEGLSLVKDWKPDDREPVRTVPKWVGFGGRDSVKHDIQKHFRGATAERLFHIAGLSGSGKTRTVIEACHDEPSLAEVVYSPALSDSVDRLLTHLNAVGGSALLIIDEVALDEYDALARRVERLPATVRIVSIGPARANEVQREGILILAPPARAEEVAAVARAAGGGLDDAVITSIAQFAGQDLRLALLLVEATLKASDTRNVPLRNNRDVWTRIRRLFGGLITCPDFDHHYGLLTTTVDVGVAGDFKGELAYLASHFGEQVGAMEACVRDAVRSGLGSMPFEHFEATPRALAQWMFFEQAWPVLKNRIDQFLHNCPSDRLRRKFLERCQELPERDRQEVMAIVRDFFLTHFGRPKLSRLSDGRDSKLFQTWAETDPEVGLEWLARAASSAGTGELAAFNGRNDYTGGWNGRRQIVWLCEHLACFTQYFNQAEETLFHLSHVETEEAIANNGTNIWKALFHPWMSYTAVPFEDRLKLLLGRLQNSEGRSLELVVAAAMAMLGDGGIRAIPPAIVGGRVRPTEWKPKTRGELLDCMQTGGREFLKITASLCQDRQLFVLDKIIPGIGRFLDLGLFDELRSWVTAVTPAEESVRRVRQELANWLSWRIAHMSGNERLTFLVDAVQSWRNSLNPRSLVDRVKDLTSQGYWEHFSKSGRPGQEKSYAEVERETEGLYRSVAGDLLNDIAAFAGLRNWLAADSNKSGDALARALAQIDSEGRTHGIVAQWIAEGTAIPTCAGYLRGLSAACKRSQVIDAALERLVHTNPGAALRLTASGDFTEIGFDRIIRCLPMCTREDLWGLRPLATYPWREILDEHRMLLLAQELHRIQQLEGYREAASAVAIDLLHLTLSEGPVRDAELAAKVMSILTDATKVSGSVGWEWVQVAKAVQTHDPKSLCRLAMDQLVKSRGGLDGPSAKFIAECAAAEPDEAMAVIGDMFADKGRRWVFRILVFRSLFDSIGIPVVSRYLEAHPDHAALISRHLKSPALGEHGELQIPELTDWMMSRFGNDPDAWDEFMMGRHSSEVFRVPEGYEAAKGVASRFVDHPKAWVRKWARAEIADMDRQIKAHQLEEDRHMRE